MMDKVNGFQSILSKVVPARIFKSDQGKKDAQAQAPGARRMNEEMCIGLRLQEEGGRCFLINLFKSTAQKASCRTDTE